MFSLRSKGVGAGNRLPDVDDGNASGAFIELRSNASTLARSCVFDICETAEAASVSLNRDRSVTEGHALLIVEI